MRLVHHTHGSATQFITEFVTPCFGKSGHVYFETRTNLVFWRTRLDRVNETVDMQLVRIFCRVQEAKALSQPSAQGNRQRNAYRLKKTGFKPRPQR
jgi:hypothetical protein